jgi:hypothetical protein
MSLLSHSYGRPRQFRLIVLILLILNQDSTVHFYNWLLACILSE